jgi:hypothetical protein
MDKRLAVIALQIISFIAPSASYAAALAAAAPMPGKTMAATNVNKSAPEYTSYTYYGDRYRDPFVALNGDYRNDQGADRPPQISSLLLKGIIQDAKGRVALLTSGVSSYILRGGRLYDGRNHMMKGISGIIKNNSVVLMGSDRTVKELKVSNMI